MRYTHAYLNSLVRQLLPQIKRVTDYCTWEGVGVIVEYFADDAWYASLSYVPMHIEWIAEFARSLDALEPTERCVRVTALATTRKLDSIPALIVIAALCTQKSVNPNGFAEDGVNMQLSEDGNSVVIEIE